MLLEEDALEVTFSDGFERQSLSLGVDRETVLAVVNRASNVQEKKLDGLIVRLFLEREIQADSYLLLIAQLKDNTLYPDVIFRVLPDLYANIMMLEPLMVLQLLVQRYGMVLRIGSRLARFYYREDIAVKQQEDLGRLVQIVDETGHDCLASYYVGPTEKSSGFVARCALAFCIDKSLYNAWLANPPSRITSKDPSYRPITRIIPVERAMEIQASCINEPTPNDRFYKIELKLAIEIIVKLLGDEWYRRVYEGLPKVSGEEDPRLLHHYIRVTGLGHFLNQLWREDDSNNFSDKIDELRGSSFEHTYFELKIAAQFDRRGFGVAFLKRKKVKIQVREQWLKTPDFRVDSADGYSYVECKRKSVSGLVIDNDVEDAALQIQEYGGPGLIFIEFQEKLNQKSVEKMLERAAILLEGKSRVSVLVFTSEELRDEGDTYAVATHAWPIQTTQTRLPETIRRAALFQDPVDWLPLSTGLPSE
jgi:hypothetical protein